MQRFFEGVGTGATSGIWEDTPRERPEFREQYERQLAKLAKQRKAEEMG
jgi:chlorophyllide a reductase subunit Y